MPADWDQSAPNIDLSQLACVERLLVACSGGPDSTALLYLLANARKQTNTELIAAYFDHALRPNSETSKDSELVASHCNRLGIPFRSARTPTDIRRFAAEHGCGVEAAARAQRLNILERIADEEQCDRIAFGHTLDDQIETYLQRMVQGAGVTGLAGIAETTDRAIRPLLSVEKAELIKYLDAHRIAYRNDATNQSNEHLRNRIRSVLIPAIQEVFPGYRRSISSGIEKANMMRSLLDARTDNELPPSDKATSGEIWYDRKRFEAAPAPLRMHALYRAFDQIVSTGAHLTHSLSYRSIRNMILDPATLPDDPSTVLKSKHVEIHVDSTFLRIRPVVVFTSEKSYLIAVNSTNDSPRSVLLEDWSLTVSTAPQNVDGEIAVPVREFPVVVRSRNPGDKIRRNSGTTSIKELLIDWAVPQDDRYRVAIVEDSLGLCAVVWFGGSRTALRVQTERHADIEVTLTAHTSG